MVGIRLFRRLYLRVRLWLIDAELTDTLHESDLSYLNGDALGADALEIVILHLRRQRTLVLRRLEQFSPQP